jgi:uncharacterized protein (TIGR03437 family)
LRKIFHCVIGLAWLAIAALQPAAAQCTFLLSPSSVHVSYQGTGSSSFTVTPSPSSCSRPAKSNDDWISVTYGQTGTAQGTVGYTVDASNLPVSRTGSITAGNAQFTVLQDAYPCTYSFAPANLAVPQTGGNYSIALTTPCSWTATATASWIAIATGASGNKNGSIALTIQPNNAVASRTGSVLINNQSYAITQFGTGCSYVVAPATASFTAAAATGQISVQTDASCSWSVQDPVAWISGLTINGAPFGTVSGSATINYAIAPNASSQNRTATLTVAGQSVAVSQTGVGILFGANGVVNGASFQSGQVAPGELISIFGLGLGPANPAGLQLTSNGQAITTSIEGTQVLFDGLAAPLTYASSSQVNAIVPFEIAGATSTEVQVEVNGVTSSAVPLLIAPSSPAIFTSPSGGGGQGAVLNQDNSPNSAANPAAIGSVLQVFATGAGQTSPAGVDGQLAGATPSTPVLNVTAQIGGVNAPVEYAGSSSGLVAGVLQVNVVVPAGAPTGDAVPLTLTIGNNPSPQGVTVAIH